MGSEWRTVEFGKLLNEPVRNGIYKPSQYHGRGAKIVNMGELFAHPRLGLVPMKRIEVTDEEYGRFGVVAGDLIFARRSLVAEGAGKCSIILGTDGPTVFESSIIRARPNPAVADPMFLYYYFNSRLGLHGLDTIRRQVAVAGITGTDLMRLPLRLPPLAEQRRIAGILSALDDKIELSRRMSQALESIARALFKSWFVDFDPVRSKVEGRDPGLPSSLADLFPDSFGDSKMGPMPAGWRMGIVADEFRLTMGQSPPGRTYNDGGHGLPFYQGRVDFGDRFPARRVYCSAPTRVAHSGDTLVSVRAPVGDMNIATEDCAIGRGVAALRHISGAVAYTYLTVDSLGEALSVFEGDGTVFGSINRDAFRSIPVLAPPPGVVQAFEERLCTVDSQLATLHSQIVTLAALRDSLLPPLVSGQLTPAI